MASIDVDPEKNFEELWQTFHNRYAFFEERGVDWQEQYDRYRPRVTAATGEGELFDIISRMLEPLNDGHVNITARIDGEKRHFSPEKTPRFWREFNPDEIGQLFETTEKTLAANGFGQPTKTEAWMLLYCRSQRFGYIRILELEGVKNSDLTAALDTIGRDFTDLAGYIVDIRDCPGGDDSTAIAIINRFCNRKRVAFHRRTKIGPGPDDFTPLKTWHLEPQGEVQFTGPVVLLTCDSVFSGGEAFALAIRELPSVTIVGDHTNGIFSYELEKKLPNGWRYTLSYQKYYSSEMVCYETKGVPVDIELFNARSDIEIGSDPLIVRALDVLAS
ncbi:MAG TPA: S41 family peptidase [Pyrinomonadaceae bacterium]|nr:S41 family peptidase [Pyrinomonadaceae bacterium]